MQEHEPALGEGLGEESALRRCTPLNLCLVADRETELYFGGTAKKSHRLNFSMDTSSLLIPGSSILAKSNAESRSLAKHMLEFLKEFINYLACIAVEGIKPWRSL